MTDVVPVQRALLSVFDKDGLLPLARALAARGVELLATGGTKQALHAAGLAVRDIATLTGWPEIMGGRVKTLHPAIHAGLLAVRDDAASQQDMRIHAIRPIDLLVVNLYPFAETIAKGAGYAEAVDMIDIGGPAMIRAAAKNHEFVATVVSTEDYPALLGELEARDGHTCRAFRQRLAQIAYGYTATYDAAVSGWMAAQAGVQTPRHHMSAATLAQPLRYGENPHQKAAFYVDALGGGGTGLGAAQQHQGKALSYNNINDASAALEILSAFPRSSGACCAIVKHASPCGVALGGTMRSAWQKACDCDRDSAFGGVVACNGAVDATTAEAIISVFTEIVVAPAIEPSALEIFKGRPNLRVLSVPVPSNSTLPHMRQVLGGVLVQERDTHPLRCADLRVVSQRTPSSQEKADMLFAWQVVKHVPSNGILCAQAEATVAIGAGKTSRIDSMRIAIFRAQQRCETLRLPGPCLGGAVLASDAFFPFADGVLMAADAGVRAFIQPGGGRNEAEVIKAADAAGLTMICTGMRHFRH